MKRTREASSPLASADQVWEEVWDALLEVNPKLKLCRVILQRRRRCRGAHADSADIRLVADQEGDADSLLQGVAQAPRSAPLEHNDWSVAIAWQAAGVLRVRLDPPLQPPSDGKKCSAVPGPAPDSVVAELQVGDSIEIRTVERLHCHGDHLCITLGLRENSDWLTQLLSPPDLDTVHNITCRACRRVLVQAYGKESLLLPSGLWQAGAEGLACEECAAFGDGHVRSAPGRVYVSLDCLLVCEADLCNNVLGRGVDGLVRCRCGAVVGELQLPSTLECSLPAQLFGKRRKLNLCREGWRVGTESRRAGVSLYKHRVSMRRPSHSGADDGQTSNIEDLLGAFSDEAAVGAHLIAQRITYGHSRFVLRPRSQEIGVYDDGLGPALEDLEVRIVASDLVVVGPMADCARHAGPEAFPASAELGLPPPAQRVAKICYRRRPCSAVPPQCHLLGIPLSSFRAVSHALDAWAAALPPSRVASPVDVVDELGSWRTSLFPLPPRDSSVE